MSTIPIKFISGLNSISRLAYGLQYPCLRLAVTVTDNRPRLGTVCVGSRFTGGTLIHWIIATSWRTLPGISALWWACPPQGRNIRDLVNIARSSRDPGYFASPVARLLATGGKIPGRRGVFFFRCFNTADRIALNIHARHQSSRQHAQD